MIRFFKRIDWRTHTRPRADRKSAAVSGASRRPYDEIRDLLTKPPTEADREVCEQLRRVWLANHEAGC